MKLSEAIRQGRKQVQRQGRSAYFMWDSRLPKWRIDKYAPNVACALGMALIGDGYKPPIWDNGSAYTAAKIRWGSYAVNETVRLNDVNRMRWDRIANRLEGMGY